MAEVEITNIHNNPIGTDTASKLNDEYIVIKNTTTDKTFKMAGLIISDTTPTGKDTHLFYFPEKVNGMDWFFSPGEYIYVRTGKGTNQFIKSDGKYPPQFHFYMQREWFVWNNPGDTAYLRLANGEFVHWMKVP